MRSIQDDAGSILVSDKTMTDRDVPESKWEREWLRGEKGGLYYLDDWGRKVYKRGPREPQPKKPDRTFKPKRGAFYRHLQSQIDSDGKNLDLC